MISFLFYVIQRHFDWAKGDIIADITRYIQTYCRGLWF